ncbi:putative membrane protein [Escovopsis weberi]|uniref:Putative membrane protein n=1 Tax=Escovopsis weberi TaxID=150374 RepID=A0A0M8MYG9_ESCWE|nr:putative membrane protein [Escovopsis weberi]
MTAQNHDQDAAAQPDGSAANPSVRVSWVPPALAPLDFDDFGLPNKEYVAAQRNATQRPGGATPDRSGPAGSASQAPPDGGASVARDRPAGTQRDSHSDSDEADFRDAHSVQAHDSRAPSPVKADRTSFLAEPKAKAPPSSDAALQPSGHGHSRGASNSSAPNAVSEYSHQQFAIQHEQPADDDDGGWQDMPAYARYDIYDDDNRLIARERDEEEEDNDQDGYAGLGGAGKGYTRVVMDEDAQSATSMDDHTQYLFKNPNGTGMGEEDDEDTRDAVAQMQATKDLLTEGQRIAYVGIVRLEVAKLVKEGEALEAPKKIKREVSFCAESIKMWGQKMMMRLYTHMDINEAEQIMIEQLAEHGVRPEDLTPALLANSRVQNPMAEEKKRRSETPMTPLTPVTPKSLYPADDRPVETPPPSYEAHSGREMPEVKTPSQLPTTEKIDIDLRWTVLCDLFLLLVADSVYDARSRVLMERVGKSLDISWLDICKFEKRVTDALEMQQQADKEDWNEDEHMEARRKAALKRRYFMMGLATVGGGLVIGLSAGLLAPVIGAGLAAGFTTIGVTGTGSFLAGAGGAAMITSTAAASGSYVGIKAANRRTGAVKTFEYRPLHNNKRVNLIVTVSGWMTGKVDDVRLPFSTVDPIMGDIYSVLWEPEMLRSMGDTINILATEALTQGLQQLLGSTILVSLMAAVQLPVVLTKLAYLIDNPWAVSLDRAVAAGQILADSLLERSLGTRPITLVGYSLGARVIFSCLQELAKRGAYGLVQNVYLFGSPIVVKKEEYIMARTVVAGRFVNGYSRNDWILGYLFRLTNGGIRRVAGLAPIEDLPWIENVDVADMVPGHMEYRTAMPMLLMHCGWVVESPEFTEIEDPDPENHKDRQRELINEIEEARRELEREGRAANRKSMFELFSRRKKTDKQEWEIYDDSSKRESIGSGPRPGTSTSTSTAATGEEKSSSSAAAGGGGGSQSGVLFDIDAIRAELAKEARAQGAPPEELIVKEIQSTMPPMKLDYSPLTSPVTPTRITEAGRREMYRNSLPVTWSSGALSAYSPTEGSFRGLRSQRGVSTSALGFRYEPKDDNDNDDDEDSNSNSNSNKEEPQMTFDTSFADRTAPPPHKSASGDDVIKGGGLLELRLPQVTIADPWNDIDEEEFGKEGHISMTFA